MAAAAHNNSKKNKKSKQEPKQNVLVAKTENQKDYIRSIIENDIIFCTGPSGTGKSFIAAGVAAEHLLKDLGRATSVLHLKVQQINVNHSSSDKTKLNTGYLTS